MIMAVALTVSWLDRRQTSEWSRHDEINNSLKLRYRTWTNTKWLALAEVYVGRMPLVVFQIMSVSHTSFVLFWRFSIHEASIRYKWSWTRQKHD